MVEEDTDRLATARIEALRSQLRAHGNAEAHLDVDLERPLRSLEDGYPENAVTLVGRIVEVLLKAIWMSKGVKGDPSTKQLHDLLNGCKDHVRDRTIRDHIVSIQSTRNRAAHDGGVIDEEDALDVLRRLARILDWYVATQVAVVESDDSPRLDASIADEVEFVAGLYLVLGYSLLSKVVLSPTIVHQLFVREQGLRRDYVELVVAQSSQELTEIASELADGLFHTEYPKAIRMIAIETRQACDAIRSDVGDANMVSFDEFLLQFIDYEAYRRHAVGTTHFEVPPLHADGQLLELDPATHDYSVTSVADVRSELLDTFLARKGNVLVIGKPGSGKSQQLRWLLQGALHAHRHGVVFFFDLGEKPAGTTVEQFLADSLYGYFDVPRHLVFPLYAYLSRSGRVLNLFDGIDEAIATNSLADFMEVFAAISELLSAESQVVMTSRTAFLEDSMYVRQLLDRDALAHDKVITEVTSAGIDPLTLPRFRVLKLGDLAIGQTALGVRGTALEHTLIAETRSSPDILTLSPGSRTAALVRSLFADAVEEGSMTAVSEYFGSAFLTNRESFSLVELFNVFGDTLFPHDLSLEACTFRSLFHELPGDRVRFRHRIFQEYLGAIYLASRPQDFPVKPNITEQLRALLPYCQPPDTHHGADCLVPSGRYVVGAGDGLMTCLIRNQFKIDRYAVSVSDYKQFLDVARTSGMAEYAHPLQPGGIDYEPLWERVLIPGYYTDPTYDQHPATAISWWSAFAYSRWIGGRLPSAVEWEVAARGDDGRIFPWGDDPEVSFANSADYWAGRPLIGYTEWKREIDTGGVRDSHPMPVDSFPENTSPFGARNMAGNVWEWTSTMDTGVAHAVMCGGSYDNPLRGTRTFSKGVYRVSGRSNVVGFRCVFEVTT